MQTLDLLNLPLAGSALIEASAGTGKTYTIAALYLRLVLGHPHAQPLLPPQILVVTFTEAATSELKGRIRSRLADAARFFQAPYPEADSFLQQLAAEFPPEQWPSCAQQLALAAQWMDDAAISTIHGWCNRMLTEHAFDSGAAFDLQLNTDLSALLLQVVEDYWRCFIYPLPLAEYRLLQQKVAEPAALLQKLKPLWGQVTTSTKATPADNNSILTTPFAALQAEITEKKQALVDLKRPFTLWIDELEQLIAQGREAGLTQNVKLRADNVSRWLAALRLWRDTPDMLMPELGSGLQRFTPEGMAEAWKGPVPNHPVLQAIADLPAAIAALPDAMQGIRLHALAWCQQRFEEQKQQLSVMGFDDLLSGLQHALNQTHGDVLAERIRQQFPFALIDEFQDTDPVQFAIFDRVYQLAEQRKDTGILLIGDPKQAIYGFRGADIYTYLQAKVKTQGHHYGLDTNFRSIEAMVQVVNLMFNQAEQRASGRGAFLFRGAATDLSFMPVKAKGRAQELRWHQPMPALAVRYLDSEKPVAKASYLAAMSEVCAAEISQMLMAGQANQCGFQHSDQLVGLQPRDIAVLVNNQQEADAIRKALAACHIRSVYLSDKGSVYQSPMAQDLWLWLDACADPRNQLKVRSALASASLSWSYALLARLQDDEWFMEQQLELFMQYHVLWQKSGVLPLVRRLMSDFQVAEHLAKSVDAERRLTDLLHLAGLLQQASRILDGERALLRYFAQQRSGIGEIEADAVKLQLESDEALVRVVTIHKSKGLEYPLVFLPFIAAVRELDAKKLPYRYYENGQYHFAHSLDERTFALAKEQRLAEDLRKLYVAMTRAQHYCWLGLASQKELSAIGYLIADDGVLQPEHLCTQLQVWLSTPDWPQVELKSAELVEPAVHFIDLSSQQALADYAVMPPRQRVPWWTASYSAIASGVENSEHKGGELYQELVHEVQEWAEVNAVQAFAEDFMRGADAGTLLHAELEWAGEQGFALIAQQPELWREHICETLAAQHLIWPTNEGWQRSFLRSELGESPVFTSAQEAVAPMWQWLLSLLSVPLLADQSSLSTFEQTKVELEFWLSADKVSTKQLDVLLQQHLWPGLTRPELDARLVNGMLKGFIDLSFMQNGRYYVADYKSNYLPSGRYTQGELVELMLAKRYDLQAACYGLAMHRLLTSRKADYQPSRDLGPAVYWFLRGSQQPTHGVLLVDLPIALITALDQLFQGQLQNVQSKGALI
jgi:exodeoxyribonuclease V beta subunit